jgi:hypothetical protein
MKENIDAYLCPHHQKVYDEEEGKIISKEQAMEMLKKLGVHVIESPYGLPMVMCEECFSQLGDDAVIKDSNGGEYHMMRKS